MYDILKPPEGLSCSVHVAPRWLREKEVKYSINHKVNRGGGRFSKRRCLGEESAMGGSLGGQRYPRYGRRLSRRDFLKVGGASLAGAALLGTAGCGGQQGGQQDGAQTIVFSFGPDDSGTLQEVVERFNREHEGEIQVEYQERSRTSDEYFRSLVSDFEAGGGDVDVIGGDVIWAAEFADNAWIEDISSRFYGDYPQDVPGAFLEAQINSVSWRNRLWGVPWFSDAGLLYDRRDLLEESGFDAAPTTWDGLKEIANQVTQESGTQYGFVFQGDNYEGGVVNGMEFIWSAGGQVLSTSGIQAVPGQPVSPSPNEVQADDPRVVEGLAMERSMVEDGVAPEEVAGYRELDAQQAFFAGDAVFLRGWPYMYTLALEGEADLNTDQIGIAQIPVSEEGNQSYSCLGGWNMYINAASEKQDAAWEFIKFATAPEQQRFRAIEGSFLPTLSELYNDQEILDQVPVMELGGEIIRNNLRARPSSPAYSRLSQRMAVRFNECLSGELSPEETAETLQREMEGLL
jgi:multiple sugar transport system substrate-binding protein